MDVVSWWVWFRWEPVRHAGARLAQDSLHPQALQARDCLSSRGVQMVGAMGCVTSRNESKPSLAQVGCREGQTFQVPKHGIGFPLRAVASCRNYRQMMVGVKGCQFVCLVRPPNVILKRMGRKMASRRSD